MPDWRDAAAYSPLLDAERSLIAWEWLRRDCAYRAAAGTAMSKRPRGGSSVLPANFGLVAFEPPEAAVPFARPLWRVDVHPFVLRVCKSDLQSPAERLDLEPLGDFASACAIGGAHHLLLSDGLRCIRLDGRDAIFSGAPVALSYRLEGLHSAEPPLLALRRLLALCRTGRFARSLHPREPRARRWIAMLRAWDALQEGAGQREIAEALLSRSAVDRGWRTREPHVRSQAQRLVRAARNMAAGGYRTLLL